MKIFAFAATNHKNSINKKLVHYTLSVLNETKADVESKVVDLIDYELPLYRQDREEKHGIPQQAKDFYENIGEADAIIISFAEHNGSYSAVYKNLFDWMSRINQSVYQDKPVIIMAASPGGRGGASILSTVETVAPFFGMNIKAKVSVPVFQDNYDFETGAVTNPDIQNQIADALKTL